MPERIYIETLIISYLTARPSRDLITAGRQQVTREWWEHCRQNYSLFVSQAVLAEIMAGDPQAAAERLAAVTTLPVLETTNEAIDLAALLVRRRILPQRATADALHLALATTGGLELLLTWNCRHLANPQTARLAYDFLTGRGLEPPAMCTPDELFGADDV